MPLTQTVINGTTVLTPVVYKEMPFYASFWFWIGVFAFIVASIIFITQFIIYRQKNRLVVRIHKPDNTVEPYVFRNFIGTEFKLALDEKTNEGETQYANYKFMPECVETGRWGRYIDYDYNHPLPINPKDRKKSTEHSMIIKFFESLANTKLLAELLLNSKFKDFVTIMLWIITILSFLSLLASIIVPLASNQNSVCTLDMSNQTLNVIRTAMRTK